MSNTSFAKRLFSWIFCLFSWIFRLVLVLLGFVLFNFLALYIAVVDNVWRGYQPWLGEPKEMIRQVNTDNCDVFHLRLSEEQLADWVQTLRLDGRVKDPTQALFYVTSTQNIKLGNSNSPEQIYSISLQRPTLVVDSDDLKDRYELYIHRLSPSEVSTKEIHMLSKRYPEQERSTKENILDGGSLLVLFFLPALLARLFVRKREGLFPFKELLFSSIIACILYVPFMISALYCMMSLLSSSADGTMLWFFTLVMLFPFVCILSSSILYLIIGLYRWWRRSRELAALPAVPDAGAL